MPADPAASLPPVLHDPPRSSSAARRPQRMRAGNASDRSRPRSIGNLGRGKHAESARKTLELLRARGETTETIAAKCGCCRYTVTNVLQHSRPVKARLAILACLTPEEIRTAGYWDEWVQARPWEAETGE